VSTSARRRTPLAAAPEDHHPADPPTEVWSPTAADPSGPEPASTADARADREHRFAQGVRSLRVGGGRFRLEERILMVAGGVIAPLGVIVVLFGWWGAAHTPYVFEQVPYLISGGLLGLGMVFLGAFLYFTHWVTQLVKEQRAQSEAVLDALQALTDEVTAGRARTPRAAGAVANGARPDAAARSLVATERGSMAHRPECVVVAGKGELRTVTTADGLTACKLCEPYAAATAST
jgi:hypothetical protein